MCEYCNKTEVTVAKLDSDDESQCEWFSEEEAPGSCDKPTVYSFSEWYVEDHLCEVHKEGTEKELEEGLADFLDRVGFGSEYEMRPIEQEEACDYISPAAIKNWHRAGKGPVTQSTFWKLGRCAPSTLPKWATIFKKSEDPLWQDPRSQAWQMTQKIHAVRAAFSH
jgi:hypothetical protein